MRDDFTMIIKKIPNNRNIKIYPISDVHLGAIEHMEKEWEEFRKRVEKEEDSYIIQAGFGRSIPGKSCVFENPVRKAGWQRHT